MTPNNININSYSSEIAQKLKVKSVQKRNFEKLANFPMIKGKQCLYVMDWQQSKLTYTRGVQNMLGYTEEEFTMGLALNYFHPEDLKFVNRIIRGAVEHSIRTDVTGDNMYLNLAFRLRKKDGSYIKVLRQSKTFEADQKGRLVSNLSFLTDISFISNNNKVEWDIYTENINPILFKQDVYKEFTDFFTKRELEIIKLINNNFTNIQIAEKLFVSKHTIATHRKNILKKSNCHNGKELLLFAHKHGIL